MPWAVPGELVPGKRLQMQLLQHAENEHDTAGDDELDEADDSSEEDAVEYDDDDEDQHSCSECVLLKAFNDLPDPVDVIYEDSEENYHVIEEDLQPGETFRGDTYDGHSFLFRTKPKQDIGKMRFKRL